MKNTIFLTLEQVITIHETQVDMYGGSHGIRHLPLLESAVYRPQMTFDSEELYPDIFDKAAALLHGLLFNHAFVDGNKRTALASAFVFLEINGYIFRLDNKIAAKTSIKIENDKWNKEKIKSWLKKHSKKIS